MEKIKLIIDTDPGVDDAIALLMALNDPRIDLLGLTTVFGNADLTLVTQNALRILEKFGFDNIPVHPGAQTALQPQPFLSTENIHGQDGLGNTFQALPKLKPSSIVAAQFLVEQILKYPHEVVVCALAPLTNIALALYLEPSITKYIKQLIVMGGAIFESGNVTPAAEANIYNDPIAADKVLTADWPLTLIGLDVTQQALVTGVMLEKIISDGGAVGSFIGQISHVYRRFYCEIVGLEGFAAHDPLAFTYVTNPELFSCIQGPVRVVTDGIARGATIMAQPRHLTEINPWWNCPFINVATKIDVVKFQELLVKSFVN